jgi:membrane protein DedA with SNARE-associated domain
MHEFIIEAIARGGYLGIFLLMAIENVFPPIPSEVIMGIGGLLVGRGTMEFWPLLAVGTLGSTAGNYVWFWIGDKWGYRRLAPVVDRHGRWLTLEWQDIENAQRFFQRHGQWVVLFLRFSPFLRTMISLPAGLAHMKPWKFLLFTFVGAGIWNVLLIMGGQWLGRYFEESQDVMAWIVLGALGLALFAYVWRVFTWKPRSEREPPQNQP